MTQEEKELVIKDLCSRLPYGVKIKDQDGDYIDVNIYNAHIEHLIDRVVSGLDKLVLRPISSMTEQEKEEYEGFEEDIAVVSTHYYIKYTYLYPFCNDMMDWLNKHHFDYRGLTPAGLALEAKEGMYNND